MICTGWSAVQQQLLNNDYHTNSTTLIFSVHTSYAFLQAFIEGTGADLQQQRRWEPVERFDFPQSGQYDVHILSRALRRPVQEREAIMRDRNLIFPGENCWILVLNLVLVSSITKAFALL